MVPPDDSIYLDFAGANDPDRFFRCPSISQNFANNDDEWQALLSGMGSGSSIRRPRSFLSFDWPESWRRLPFQLPRPRLARRCLLLHALGFLGKESASPLVREIQVGDQDLTGMNWKF